MQVFLVEVVTYITRQICVSMVFILSKVIRYKIKLKNLDMQNQLMIFNGLVHPDSSERTRQNGKDNSNFEGALPSAVIRDGVNQYV